LLLYLPAGGQIPSCQIVTVVVVVVVVVVTIIIVTVITVVIAATAVLLFNFYLANQSCREN
jgi:hypothetical protein